MKRLLLAFGLVLSVCSSGSSQTYPSRPIKVIVSFGAGSGGDVNTRIILDQIGKDTGAQFIVEVRPGANGIIGAIATLRSPPDGYTLMMSGTSTHALAPFLSKAATYDPVKDFTHIGLMTFIPFAVVVPADSKYSTIDDLIADAKARPGALTYGYNGGGAQLNSLEFKRLVGIDAQAVPYQGSGPGMTDLVGGRINYYVIDGVVGSQQAKGGQVKVLVVLTNDRSALFPNAPSLKDAKLPSIELTGWTGLAGPAGIQEDARKWLAEHLRKALDNPSVVERLKNVAVEVAPPVDVERFVATQVTSWGEAAKRAGLAPE